MLVYWCKNRNGGRILRLWSIEWAALSSSSDKTSTRLIGRARISKRRSKRIEYEGKLGHAPRTVKFNRSIGVFDRHHALCSRYAQSRRRVCALSLTLQKEKTALIELRMLLAESSQRTKGLSETDRHLPRPHIIATWFSWYFYTHTICRFIPRKQSFMRVSALIRTSSCMFPTEKPVHTPLSWFGYFRQDH